jgi:hypothetical protein
MSNHYNDVKAGEDWPLMKRLDGSRVKGWPDVAYVMPQKPVLAQLVKGEVAILPERRPALSGWIELKVVSALISNAKLPKHYTPEQALFLETWARAGGRSRLLIADNDMVMLLDHGFISARQMKLYDLRFELGWRAIVPREKGWFRNLLEYL